MPGLYRINGFLVYFWANESGEPVHVHVSRGRPANQSAKFWILENGEVSLAKGSPDMTAKELRGIQDFVRSVSPEIVLAWQEMFGYVRFHE